MRLEKLWQRTALVVLAALAGLLALEAGLRVYSALFYPRMKTLDPVLGWRHAPGLEKVFTNEDGEPGVVRTNRFGHRGAAHPIERVPGKYRILVLGDSFAEGVQVGEDDLFTAVLERSVPDLEVINAGVGGYGTVQELLLLREEGLAWQPDLVLVMFYGNDLADNCLSFSPNAGPRPHARILDGEVQVVEHPAEDEFLEFCAPVPFASFLIRHSYLFYAFQDRVYQRVRADELRRKHLQKLDRFSDEVRYRIFFDLVRRMRRLAESRGAGFALALIPTIEEVRGGESEVHPEIRRFCAGEGIPALSLLEPMVCATAQGRRPHFDRDIHWTRAGHEIAAEELARFVAAQR